MSRPDALAARLSHVQEGGSRDQSLAAGAMKSYVVKYLKSKEKYGAAKQTPTNHLGKAAQDMRFLSGEYSTERALQLFRQLEMSDPQIAVAMEFLSKASPVVAARGTPKRGEQLRAATAEMTSKAKQLAQSVPPIRKRTAARRESAAHEDFTVRSRGAALDAAAAAPPPRARPAAPKARAEVEAPATGKLASARRAAARRKPSNPRKGGSRRGKPAPVPAGPMRQRAAPAPPGAARARRSDDLVYEERDQDQDSSDEEGDIAAAQLRNTLERNRHERVTKLRAARGRRDEQDRTLLDRARSAEKQLRHQQRQAVPAEDVARGPEPQQAVHPLLRDSLARGGAKRAELAARERARAVEEARARQARVHELRVPLMGEIVQRQPALAGAPLAPALPAGAPSAWVPAPRPPGPARAHTVMAPEALALPPGPRGAATAGDLRAARGMLQATDTNVGRMNVPPAVGRLRPDLDAPQGAVAREATLTPNEHARLSERVLADPGLSAALTAGVVTQKEAASDSAEVVKRVKAKAFQVADAQLKAMRGGVVAQLPDKLGPLAPPGAAQRKGKNVRAPIVAQAAIAPQPTEKYSLPWKDYRRRWAE